MLNMQTWPADCGIPRPGANASGSAQKHQPHVYKHGGGTRIQVSSYEPRAPSAAYTPRRELSFACGIPYIP